MFYYVYILQSIKTERQYIGYTQNITRRLAQHNAGHTTSTQPYRPWRILYFEGYTNQTDALEREKYFKTSKGKRALKLMLKHSFQNNAY